MPLIAEEPPRTLPRGTEIARPSRAFCGAVVNSQLCRASLVSFITPKGTVIKGLRSAGPASIRQTVTRGSADRRLASTAPEDPAPTMT